MRMAKLQLRQGGRSHLRAVPPGGEAGAHAPSDAALVALARAGEGWASEALCRRYAPLVIGLSHRLLGRDDEADDLAQEAFAQALGSLDSLDEPRAFAGWIKTIVIRTAHKIVRRRALMRRLGLVARGDSATAADEIRVARRAA